VHQPERRRYVVHLLYAPPLQRGRCLVIEDLVPLKDVPVELYVEEPVQRAYLVPAGDELPMRQVDGGVAVTVPEFTCHCAVVFGY
jgi:hypothetical protein